MAFDNACPNEGPGIVQRPVPCLKLSGQYFPGVVFKHQRTAPNVEEEGTHAGLLRAGLGPAKWNRSEYGAVSE